MHTRRTIQSILLLFVFFITSSLTSDAPPQAEENDTKIIPVTLRNVSYPAEDPQVRYLQDYWRRRERKANLPLSKTAIILIDIWNKRNERLQDNPLVDEIIEDKIAPLLEVARKANMVVIYAVHRPIGWDGMNLGPTVDHRNPMSSGRDELPEFIKNKKLHIPEWPPLEFICRVGEFKQFATDSDPLYLPYTQVLGIHPKILPIRRKKEYIEYRLGEVKQILKDNGILHLVYAGGATNICVVERPVGIRIMSFLGYNTIILRDATWGSELPDTWDTLDITKAAVLDIEINNGFSASSEELVSEIRKCLAKANN